MNQLKRRKFLKWSLLGTGTLLLGWRRFGGYPSLFASKELTNLSPKTATILAHIIGEILPPSAKSDATSRKKYVLAVDNYLTSLAPFDIFQVNMLLHSFEHTPLLFQFRLNRFSRLPKKQKISMIADWKMSSIGLRRLAFQTLKTMSFLAYYRDKESFQNIGYDGPIVTNYQGPLASQKRYNPLLAPLGKEPTSP